MMTPRLYLALKQWHIIWPYVVRFQVSDSKFGKLLKNKILEKIAQLRLLNTVDCMYMESAFIDLSLKTKNFLVRFISFVFLDVDSVPMAFHMTVCRVIQCEWFKILKNT